MARVEDTVVAITKLQNRFGPSSLKNLPVFPISRRGELRVVINRRTGIWELIPAVELMEKGPCPLDGLCHPLNAPRILLS